MKRSLLFGCLLIMLFFGKAVGAASGLVLASLQESKVAVSITIIADSVNTLSASVMVEPGTNARDLMEKLFQVEYADRGKKFVKGIAGFGPRLGQRAYWALEIDGAYAQVGIAEATIDKRTKLLWRLTAY